MNGSFLSKLVHFVVGKYFVDPIAPFGHLHFFESVVHLILESFLGFGASTVSYDPIGKLLNATGLDVYDIAVETMLV